MIAIAVPGFACLVFGSLALRIFWSVIAQVNVNFGGGRPAQPVWWPILLVYALWSGVLIVRQVTNARREPLKKAKLWLLLLLAIPGIARASEPTAPESFGPNTSLTVFSMHEFVTDNSVTDWFVSGSFGEPFKHAGLDLVAPLRGIPEGALITEIYFYFFDIDPDQQFEGSLCRYHTPVVGGHTEFDCPVQETYVGGSEPGAAVLVVQPNITFRSYDPVGFGQAPEIVSWQLGAESGSAFIGIRMVAVLWQRQVSPPPGVPTFNDVPVSDPAFQFIEALADSNITAGCGSGNFCPDAPLTRRQMAVFLAKALGLHWAFGS